MSGYRTNATAPEVQTYFHARAHPHPHPIHCKKRKHSLKILITRPRFFLLIFPRDGLNQDSSPPCFARLFQFLFLSQKKNFVTNKDFTHRLGFISVHAPSPKRPRYSRLVECTPFCALLGFLYSTTDCCSKYCFCIFGFFFKKNIQNPYCHCKVATIAPVGSPVVADAAILLACGLGGCTL